MSVSTPLVVTGIGAVSPVGNDVTESCASERAEICGFAEHPYFNPITPDPKWDPKEPFTAALQPAIDHRLQAPERLLHLAGAALRNLVKRARLKRGDLDRTALMFALPRGDEVVARWRLEHDFAPELLRRMGWSDCHVAAVEQSGHVGVFRLVAEAQRLLAEGQFRSAVIVGVDSYHSIARLRLLDGMYRLRSERAPDGFLPGEAAAAVLVEAKGANRLPLAALGTPGFGEEPRPLEATPKLSSSANGLADAISAAVDDPTSWPPWIFSDLNGESYRAFEWALLATRHANQVETMLPLEHPAECFGDVGAASGGMLLACAVHGFARGYAPAKKALLWTASDDTNRAALQIEAPSEK